MVLEVSSKADSILNCHHERSVSAHGEFVLIKLVEANRGSGSLKHEDIRGNELQN